MVDHLLRLLGLAAVDSVNLLAFAVIAGLWVSSLSAPAGFPARAARFTGGAFCGIIALSVVSVWVIGSNKAFFQELFDNLWVMLVLAVLGAVLAVVGIRQPAQRPEETVEAPVARKALQRYGIAATGIVLGIVQSGTSVPFAAGMVVISFADTPVWSQLGQILFFALVAVAPSIVLIVLLSRIHPGRTATAVAVVNRFLAKGRTAARWLTVLVGVALLGLAVVRMAQIAG